MLLTTRKLVIATTALLAMLTGAVSIAQGHGDNAHKITAKGDKCVEPTEFMRRNHMDLILHQRDKTLREGIRTKKHSLKECINCHADPKTNSVLGEDGFCSGCHQYTAVSIDCFGCHNDKAEPDQGTAGAHGSKDSLAQDTASGTTDTNTQ